MDRSHHGWFDGQIPRVMRIKSEEDLLNEARGYIYII